MTARFLAFIPWILQWEGSVFENDPDDLGGATKYGIDQRSHPNVDIANLTRDEAIQIYFDSYWTPLCCEKIIHPVSEVVMNIGVNCGKSRAANWLQDAVGETSDGLIGRLTIHATNEFIAGPMNIAYRLLDRTEAHYRDSAKGSMAKFLKGWLNRNQSLRDWVG